MRGRKNSLIPKSRPLDVIYPPAITPVEFIQQVINNVNAQLLPLDTEVAKARVGDVAHVRALYDCLHEIKSRTEQAEMILLEITHDPKKLEFSNARIDGPAETFFQLNQLMESVKVLEKELREGEYDYYRVISELLAEVYEQMIQFKQYAAIPHVEQIFKKVEAIEAELKRQVQWSFREIGSLTSSERYDHEQEPDQFTWNLDVSALNQAYLVVDVLGSKFRKDLLERFAQLQFISYEKLFQSDTKYGGLEFVEQRFAWFKYLLHLVNSKLHDVLPSKWQVSNHFYTEFTRRTKKHLHVILTEMEKETEVLHDQKHLEMILKALKSVIAFEAEMNASFIAKERFDNESEEKKSGDNGIQESIRDAFDPFLSGYVSMERMGLEELMKEIMHEEEFPAPLPTGEAEKPLPVLPNEPYESSRKMFEYIKSSLKRCTAFSTGLTYLSLSKEYRICLHQYCESLKFRCPIPIVAARNGKPPVYKFSKTIEQTLCRIITTCEYCIDTIPALETKMKQKIRPELKEEVDFSPQIEVFNDLVKYSTNILCLGEIQRMEADFQAMKGIDWARIHDVRDVGVHVKHELRILSDCVTRIRLTMSAPFFLNVCINLASTFLDSFLSMLWSLKRISKTGAGQLLMDLNGIKDYLIIMPNIKLPEGNPPLNVGKAYSFAIEKKIKYIENILKLICLEDNQTEEMFSVLWPEATKSDKERILSLKASKPTLAVPMPQLPIMPSLPEISDFPPVNLDYFWAWNKSAK